jgi:ABC-2 type transport system permease protein
MTASITISAASAGTPRLAGIGALVRKERMEWFRGRRAWVVAIVTTILMVLTAANAWINMTLRGAFPAEETADLEPLSMAVMDNIGMAVSAQLFVVVAILALASLVVRERESGTLAWVASKPVARRSIYAAKWVAAAAMLTVVAVLVPLGVTTAAAVPMYGTPDPLALVAMAAGMIALLVFYAAVALTLGTIFASTAAVAGVTFGVFAIPLFIGFIPVVMQLLPHSIIGWFAGLASGAEVGFVTPISWAVLSVAIAAVGIRRIERLEL